MPKQSSVQYERGDSHHHHDCEYEIEEMLSFIHLLILIASYEDSNNQNNKYIIMNFKYDSIITLSSSIF